MCASSSARWRRRAASSASAASRRADARRRSRPTPDHALEPHPRPDGDRARPRAAGQRGAAHGGAGGQREAALHVARLALARSAHAARRDHRRGDDVAAIRRHAGAEKRRDLLRLDRGGGRAAGPLHRQSARHVAHRGRRAEAESGRSSMSRDVVRAAVERARKAFPSADFSTSLARDLPFAQGDPALIEQVLFNLLDNAQKYGGERPIVDSRAGRRRRSDRLGHRRGAGHQARRPRTRFSRSSIRAASRTAARPASGSGCRSPRAHRGDGRPHLGGEPGGAAARRPAADRPAARQGDSA